MNRAKSELLGNNSFLTHEEKPAKESWEGTNNKVAENDVTKAMGKKKCIGKITTWKGTKVDQNKHHKMNCPKKTWNSMPQSTRN